MQDWPLTVDKILEHARNWNPNRQVVTRRVEDGEIERIGYGELYDRAKQVTNALRGLGVQPGDRVGTLAWNTARHMEAWYGIMGMGAVCHTLNPRLHPQQLGYIINHAEDRVIFADTTFAPILAGARSMLPKLERLIVMTDRANMPEIEGALCYEDLIAAEPAQAEWGGFDENTACGLCYTSGTTGDPKGVLYSHRSNFLHTLITLQADVMGASVRETILAIVPMFHANAWGLAFSAPAVGAKLVMPGSRMDGPSIHHLLESEEVTYSAAVPTVWSMLLQHLRATGGRLTTLKKVLIGGSAVPEAMIRIFHDEFGVEVVQGWGMTETSPVGTIGNMTPEFAGLPFDHQVPHRVKQGRPPLGIELRLQGQDGSPAPHDGKAFGPLLVKGPTVAAGYFKGVGGDILDADGFFDTGDVATIDPDGYMQITDRAKDVIKSGGEWISSIDVENIAIAHPKAALCAVVGVAHPKWEERPLLVVQLKPGEEASREEMLGFLHGKVAKWWVPDDVVFTDDLPLGATGKIDKKVLRARYAEHLTAPAQAAE